MFAPRFLARLCVVGAFALLPGAQTASDDGAVLVIDGAPVAGDEYGRWMIDLFASRMSRRFAEQWVVRAEAQRRGVELAPDALAQRMDAEVAERVRGAFLGRREDWLEELRRLGSSEGGYRTQRANDLEPELLATEMCRRERVVPEAKIVRDWELFYGPEGHEFTLSGILIKVVVESPPDGAPREIYEEGRRRIFASALARALDVRERALSGADFAALARECSDDDVTRDGGGRIGVKFRPPGWNEPFVKSLLALGPGAISTPLYAKGGYWIVKVEGLVVTPLAAVREELSRRLVELGPEQDEFGATWNALCEGVEVELDPAMFDARASSPEAREPVVGMRIDGTPVPRSAFALWLLRGRGEHYARDFAEHFLIEREARARGIAASPAEVEARIDAQLQWMLNQSYHGSRDAWLASLRARGRDEFGWRREWERRMRIDVLTEKLARSERAITDAQVEARWRQIYGVEGKWVEARMILVGLPAPQTTPGMAREEVDAAVAAARETARALAERLVARLADGEDFAALARTYSSDAASRALGGRLDGRFRPDAWPSEVADVVMALEPGRNSPALDTGKGFGIFEVLSARPVPFADVKDQIRAELENEPIAVGDLAGYRNVLYNRSKVEVLPAMYSR